MEMDVIINENQDNSANFLNFHVISSFEENGNTFQESVEELFKEYLRKNC